MANNNRNMQQNAMLLGTYMGVFWILKFILFPLGMSAPFFSLLFIVLTLCVPFLGYYYARMYRNQVCQGYISFGQAWMFTTFMYMFASVLVAVAHYIYFRYLDNGFILDTCESQIALIEAANLPNTEGYITTLREALDNVRRLSPIDITMQMISQNVFTGMMLALPTALFVARRKPATPDIDNV